jgi:hypothetical protein
MATPVGETGSQVRFARNPRVTQRANVNVESWITSTIGELLSCDASNDSQNQFQGQLDIDRVIVEASL